MKTDSSADGQAGGERHAASWRNAGALSADQATALAAALHRNLAAHGGEAAARGFPTGFTLLCGQDLPDLGPSCPGSVTVLWMVAEVPLTPDLATSVRAVTAGLAALGGGHLVFSYEAANEEPGRQSSDALVVRPWPPGLLEIEVHNAADPVGAVLTIAEGSGLPCVPRRSSDGTYLEWQASGGIDRRPIQQQRGRQDIVYGCSCPLPGPTPECVWYLVSGAMAARGCRRIGPCKWSYAVSSYPIPEDEFAARYRRLAELRLPATSHSLSGRLSFRDLSRLQQLIDFVGPHGTFELSIGDTQIEEWRRVDVSLVKGPRGYRIAMDTKDGCTEAELRALLDIPFALKPGR
jgi:hypothetical protein